MLFVQVLNDQVVAVTSKTTHGEGWQSRWNWKSFEAAQKIAEGATALTGNLHFATDSGPNVSPRFDIIQVPAVGDEVSYGFNGDYYPDGVITHVTQGTARQVRTSTGNIYFRRGNSGNWRRGGTWSLIPGHHNERNPSF